MGSDYDVIELISQLQTLRKVAKDYKGKTIENIIQQIDSRLGAIGLIKIQEILQ